jgi:hypothetical protein
VKEKGNRRMEKGGRKMENGIWKMEFVVHPGSDLRKIRSPLELSKLIRIRKENF